MRTSFTQLVVLALLLPCALFLAGCEEDPPELISVDPEFGSELQLITVRGANLADITELLFNGQPINFNTAYNSDNALLFRIPEGTPLGMYTVTVRTAGGSFDFPFLVSEPPPTINSFFPRSGDPGDIVTIAGENFFDPPLEVYFRNATVLEPGPTPVTDLKDSIPAEVVFVNETKDTMQVRVPEGASTGTLTIVANGGQTTSLLRFFTFERQLVTDFDGNGLRPDFESWTKAGNNLDQIGGGRPFLRDDNPAPIDGNFLQLSGRNTGGGNFIGFVRSPTNLDSFDIEVQQADQAFLEFDVNSGGRANSYLTIILREQGSGDFTSTIELDDEEGWQTIRQPMVRFRNSGNFVVTPGAINAVGFALLDEERTGRFVQANIDNVRLVTQE